MNIDLNFLQRSFSRAASTYEQHAHMQNAMGARLCTLLTDFLHSNHYWGPGLSDSLDHGRPKASAASGNGTASAALPAKSAVPAVPGGLSVLEIGCGPGNFTSQLLSRIPVSRLCLNDLSPAMIERNLQSIGSKGGSGSDCDRSCGSSDSGGGSSAGPAALAAGPEGLEISHVCGNAMELDWSSSPALIRPFDLIVSNATFQWFSSLPDALRHCRTLAAGRTGEFMGEPFAACQSAAVQAQTGTARNCFSGGVGHGLSSAPGQGHSSVNCHGHSHSEVDGQGHSQEMGLGRGRGAVLAFSSFYQGNFAQIREMAGLSLDYLSREQVEQAVASAALPAQYQIVFDVQHQYFPGALELFRSLKETGVTAISERPISAGSFRRMLALYEQRYGSDQGVCLTWHPYYVIARLS